MFHDSRPKLLNWIATMVVDKYLVGSDLPGSRRKYGGALDSG